MNFFLSFQSLAEVNLDKLLEDMRLHPNRYVHFSVFGKKEKVDKKSKQKK